MAWTSMHFTVGMAGGMALFGAGCLIARRGWRWLPVAMTVGGVWALVPDLPRLLREDFPSLPFAATLGDLRLERALHTVGDLFFFHAQLDAQPHEYALHGFIGTVMLYNLAAALLLARAWRDRRHPALRAWEAHEPPRRPQRPPPDARPVVARTTTPSTQSTASSESATRPVAASAGPSQ